MVALFAAATGASALWTSVDNFDGLTTGALGTQNNWVSLQWNTSNPPIQDYAVVEVSAGNNALNPIGRDAGAYNAAGITNFTGTGTVYFEFRAPTASVGDISFGLTPSSAPTNNDFNAFGAQIGFGGSNVNGLAAGTPGIRVRNGGGFTGFTALAVETTYQFWLVANVAAKTSTLYVQGGQWETQTALFSNFGFRTASTELAALLIRGGAGDANSTFLIDNIYMDATGANLTAVPEPSTYAALAGLLAFVLVVMRRRRA
jgi:hypothetical protein